MIISKLKRVVVLIYNFLNFYRRNGARLTFIEVQNRLKLRTPSIQPPYDKDLHMYQYLVDKFPQSFTASQNPTGDIRQWKTLADSAAQLSLRNLLVQLNISVDPDTILPLIKNNLGENRYFHLLDNLFSLERLKDRVEGMKVHDLVQTSSLPEISEDSPRRRILFVTSQFPNPQNGGGNRVLNFIKILSKNNDIYLSTCFVPEDDEQALKEIAPYCCSIQKIPLWRFGGNQAEILTWLDGNTMDIVHYEWLQSLQNYDPAYGKYHIFTYMEAASLRLLIDMKNLEPLSDPWLINLSELTHTLCLELVEASRLSARIAVTTKDGNFFRGVYPYQEYAVLNHGITFDDFCLPDIEPESHTLVFVGNYQHQPNVDAMEYFFREIWNDILNEVPNTHIYVIGPKPPKEIKRYASNKQITVTGGVVDIRPYIQKASVCIAPLITGAGMRGKVIDYAALRRTFVATSIATTDLSFQDGVDYLHADTAQEFILNVVSLLRDENRAKRMGIAAYETARQNYDNRRLVNFLLRFYDYLEAA